MARAWISQQAKNRGMQTGQGVGGCRRGWFVREYTHEPCISTCAIALSPAVFPEADTYPESATQSLKDENGCDHLTKSILVGNSHLATE